MAQAMSGVVDLKRGEPLRMPTRRTVRLTALGGLVWVTQAGDLDDHFLVAVQTMLVAAGKQAVISAERGAARVAIALLPR